MKQISLMLIICAVLTLISGCRKKVGLVKMDNIVTVHELYKNRNKYIGQVVTVVWDSTVIRGSGFNRFPVDDSLNSDKIYDMETFTPEGLKRIGMTQQQYNDYVRSIVVASKGMEPPCIDFDAVELGVIRDYDDNHVISYPQWISDSVKNKFKILQIKDPLNKSWCYLGYGKHNWVTGVLIGFYTSKNSYAGVFEEDLETNCCALIHIANILPLGYMYESK